MPQQQIRKLAIEVDDLLRSYVAIHNECFPFSLRRIIPALFRAIDFNYYVSELATIGNHLSAAREEAIRILPQTKGLERQYLEVLSPYLDALCETVTLLSKIVLSLKLKNEDKLYGWQSYSRDVQRYKLSTNKYAAIGMNLNENWRRLYVTFHSLDYIDSADCWFGRKNIETAAATPTSETRNPGQLTNWFRDGIISWFNSVDVGIRPRNVFKGRDINLYPFTPRGEKWIEQNILQFNDPKWSQQERCLMLSDIDSSHSGLVLIVNTMKRAGLKLKFYGRLKGWDGVAPWLGD